MPKAFFLCNQPVFDQYRIQVFITFVVFVFLIANAIFGFDDSLFWLNSNIIKANRWPVTFKLGDEKYDDTILQKRYFYQF